ncbi:hypothetical protein [Cypionkella sinensis]|uniref:Uncharacterized protein n=1 Tax=Cypionkella sinensis TaxID=1756043 RepID=A0ABV7IXT4_9RHOB
MKTFLRMVLHSIDSLISVQIGRPDKYWAWAVAALIYPGVLLLALLFDRNRLEFDNLSLALIISGPVLALILVPLRKKWGWPRG